MLDLLVYNFFIYCTSFCLQPPEVLERKGQEQAPNGINVHRCAQLIAVAMANKLDEVWISLNPVLFFTYAAQYAPSMARW